MYTSGPSDKNRTLVIFNWTIFLQTPLKSACLYVCKHIPLNGEEVIRNSVTGVIGFFIRMAAYSYENPTSIHLVSPEIH